MTKITYLGIEEQIIRVSTSFANVCRVVSFTNIIHVYFVMMNVVKLDTHSQFVKLMFIFLEVNLNDSNSQLLFLFATFSKSFHIQNWLYLSSNAFYDFTVDTGSIRFIISVEKLESSNPNAVIIPSKVSTSSFTGNKLSIPGCCSLLIRNGKSLIVNFSSLSADYLR